MRAKNKIVKGYFEEFEFVKKYGKLYIKCLEQEFAMNEITVRSIQIIDVKEYPSLCNTILKGFILEKIFGKLGLVAGVLTAGKNYIYKVRITFFNGGIGLAEIDDNIYRLLVQELFQTN